MACLDAHLYEIEYMFSHHERNPMCCEDFLAQCTYESHTFFHDLAV
jgi:hypothetical protein